MKTNLFRILMISLLLSWLLVGCMGQTEYEENVQVENAPTSTATIIPEMVKVEETEAVPVEATAVTEPDNELLSPAETVSAFYQEYTTYVGDDMLRTEKNPLVDGVYQNSPYLTAHFIANVDAYVAGYNPYGFDPVVMAMQMPDSWTVDDAVMADETATVTLWRSWDSLVESLPLQVQLRLENDRWLIDAVSVVMADGIAFENDAPETAVADFYTWYLAYTGSPAAGEFRNPMADRIYADSPYLTPDLVAAMDENLSQMHEREMGGADPFLCAQNIPVSVYVPSGYDMGMGTQARVLLRTGFYNSHYLVLTLQKTDEQWRIDEIECASQSPAGTAVAFYTWYLGYIGDRADGDFRNPLVDGAYRDTPFLSEDFVGQVDALLSDSQQGGYDPFLQAQDIPHGFTVQPGPDADQALVTFYFLDEENEPYNEWLVLLSFIEENGRYQINAIDSQNVPPIATFNSPDYGFTFHYPADWVMAELEAHGDGPDDWPVVAVWQLMPADVAEQIAAQPSPPDPNAPPIVASFQIELVEGDETAVARAFLPLDTAEVQSIGRKLVYYFAQEPGYSHQIFPHPYRADTWIVITDWVTQFPGREVQGELSAPVLTQLQTSLQFQQ